jgi:hypothetical protein
MSEFYPKLIESNHYHLWTDVLHARKLAHQTSNKWDRGAYVRWVVMISWTVLEIACQEALNDSSISYSFKKNLDKALSNQNLKPLDWGQGIWQQVTQLQEIRKNCVHRFATETDLFPDTTVVDQAIETVRTAVKDIFSHVGKVHPSWIADDTDKGWESAGVRAKFDVTVIRGGLNPDDPEAIKIAYVHGGKEHIEEILPPQTDYEPVVGTLLKNIRVPISMIRVYKGDHVVYEQKLNMRDT